MNDKEIDELLGRAADTHEVDPVLLRSVSSSIGASLQPVRPMAPPWILALALVSISAGIAFVAAWLMGFYGIRKLGGAEIIAIFSALGIFMWLVATMSVAEIMPGSRRWIDPARLLVIVMIGWLAVDAVLFRDYDMSSFMTQGWPCLRAGLTVAIPTGAASWLALRRGFAVDPASAGLAAGTLAGMAGLAMLELHCPNFRAPHVMVWHTAVVPVSAVVGTLVAGIVRRRS
jgi:hypothetical protein